MRAFSCRASGMIGSAVRPRYALRARTVAAPSCSHPAGECTAARAGAETGDERKSALAGLENGRAVCGNGGAISKHAGGVSKPGVAVSRNAASKNQAGGDREAAGPIFLDVGLSAGAGE